jgi:hypothetical protein
VFSRLRDMNTYFGAVMNRVSPALETSTRSGCVSGRTMSMLAARNKP